MCKEIVYIWFLISKVNSSIFNPLVGKYVEDAQQKRKGAKTMTPRDWWKFYMTD